jgi:hypothetical protein
MTRFSRWMGAGMAAAAAAAGAAPALAQPDFEGVWQVERGYNVQSGTKPSDGSPIPFLPWSKTLYDASVVANAAGDPWPPNNQRCLVAGVVRALKGNFPFAIMQTEKQVVFLFEEDGRVNQFPFRAEHKKALRPTWYGDPIARWDGDTLVIDTIGYNEKTPFIPTTWHTSTLHTVDRVRLINGGKELEFRELIDDPAAFTKPWEVRLVFARMPPTYKLRDYRCIENNRDIPLTGAWGPD